jgi:hypothetical protein
MWFKDMAAGAAVLIFIVSSFALTSGAQTVLAAL